MREYNARPAISWARETQHGQGQTQTCCAYWDVDFLLENESESQSKENSVVHLSYKTVFLLTSIVVNTLRQKLESIIVASISAENEGTPTTSTGMAIPVAVAIPEGPFLPLAVLAVHALNRPFSVNTGTSGNSGVEAYAVLVPIEPGEGKDRIRHMLIDTGPALLLCLPPDHQKMLEIVSILHRDSSEETSTRVPLSPNTCLFQSKNSHLINFAELMREAVKEMKSVLAETEEQEDVLPEALMQTLKRFYLQEDNLQHCIANMASLCAPSASQPETKFDGLNRLSHIAFTSGSTGKPKGSISSIHSLQHYIHAKNQSHDINHLSIVLLASAASFDPCLSDILATFSAMATLGMASRSELTQNLPLVLKSLSVTHVLCTPTLWSTMNTAEHGIIGPKEFPFLKLVALGGEPISKALAQTWARCDECPQNDSNDTITTDSSIDYEGVLPNAKCRLYATYGVTEACVYQTMGEITRSPGGQQPIAFHVGKPLDGMRIRICVEDDQEHLVDASHRDLEVGEIVLYGSLLDEWSGYLNAPELTHRKFIKEFPSEISSSACNTDHDSIRIYYRTGDRGYIDTNSGDLVVSGRIGGEEGMVKLNGVRIELGEIEAALIDDYHHGLKTPDGEGAEVSFVVNAAVVANDRQDSVHGGEGKKELFAYCVIRSKCSIELGVGDLLKEHPGVLCNSGSVLTLLRSRCKEKVRAGCTPSAFIFVRSIPLAPTGKRQLAGLPLLSECCPLERHDNGKLLREYGSSGKIVAAEIISCLNLQPCQQSMLVTTSSFGMLGGDSLAATRIVRALYAKHHGVHNSRFLGGKYGAIDGPFAAVHLINAESLGHYVDFLDRNCICSGKGGLSCEEAHQEQPNLHPGYAISTLDNASDDDGETVVSGEASRNESSLYGALMTAMSLGHTSLALSLLAAGADPNWGDHGGRLGKVSGRNTRKALFKSSPLHLACLRGDPLAVKGLLRRGAKLASPDASGSYPLHLAASGKSPSQHHRGVNDYASRLECVQLLLEAGAPLLMKDANKQTVLHCAARAGNCELIDYIMPRWKLERGDRDIARDSSIDWRDHWSRTCLHWTILNGHIDALRKLLEHGCNPEPPCPKQNAKRSSIAAESPLELCERLYGTTKGIGVQISTILQHAKDH